MARHSRTVADRQRSLEPVPPEANFTLFAVREMYEGMGGREFRCSISGYCRTRIPEPELGRGEPPPPLERAIRSSNV